MALSNSPIEENPSSNSSSPFAVGKINKKLSTPINSG